jgi:Protein of unknown function (DUF3631)
MAPHASPAQPAYRDAAALLEACRKWVHRYVVLSDDQGNVIAVWVLHTWAIDAADYTSYLHITAAEKECGKSRLLETLEPIVCSPCMSVGTTAAALLRILHRDSPTLLLDEVDTTFGGSKDAAESIRGILNAGFRRGGIHRKCEGKSHQLQEFKAFGPKAFAGIGGVPDTVASRSIVIEMRRKAPEEKVEPFRLRDVMEASKSLAASLQAWSKSGVIDTLRGMRPSFPDGFGDRQQDISEPLLAIADLAGGEWPSALRRSLLALFRSESSEDSSLGVALLRDILAVFNSLSGEFTDRITSSSLTSALLALEGSPWSDWEKGRQFTVNTLAKRLKPFHIKPNTIRMGSETHKGYLRDWFTDTWKSYLPNVPIEAHAPVTPVTPVTAVTILNREDFSPFREPSHPRNVMGRKAPEGLRPASSVTAVTPVTAPEQQKPNPLVEGVL